MPHVTDAQRRARLARRHGLHPDHRLADPLAVTRALTVLHATEPASVHLAVHARSASQVTAVENALHRDRSLVKQLAMRRTLFAFPRDLLPAAWGSASARVATAHRSRLAKDVEAEQIAADGHRWLATAEVAVLGLLAEGPRSAREIRESLPELTGRLTGQLAGRPVSTTIAPRVITQLGLEAKLVRAGNDGHWRTSRPRYALMADWLGEDPLPLTPAAGYAELVTRWLRSFGPGTETDLVWWLGATKTAVRAALVEVAAVEVSLDQGGTGWLLPDDLDPEPDPGPWAALLPVLDPTVMAWKQRDWYLGPHAPLLFDCNGNAGTTVWVDGRAVGCWVQDADGTVRISLLTDVGAEAGRALQQQAERLTAWLDGTVVLTVYPSPAMLTAR